MTASLLKSLSHEVFVARIRNMHPQLPALVASNRRMSAAEQLANPTRVYRASKEEALVIRECIRRGIDISAL